MPHLNLGLGKEMAKTVTTLSGRVFETLKSAKAHFSDLRESLSVGDILSEPSKSDILDIYQRYCVATKWKSEDAIDVTTAWDNKPRSRGYAQTKAFAVITTSGSTVVFSIDKALESIAS